MRWLALAILVAACSKDSAPDQSAAAIGDAEVKRAIEACTAYATKVCACAAPQAVETCKLAKGLPETIEVSRKLAQNPKAEPADSRQAATSIRATVKHCIEETAKLAELGCL